MADLPSTIRVGYRDYTVEVWPGEVATEGHKWGSANHTRGSIKVSVVEGQDGAETANTVLHEVLHACWCVAEIQQGDHEERVIRTFTNALCQVWRDNPELVAFLDGKLRG